MKRTFPIRLQINCEGLSKKLIAELADRLSMHFENVSVFGTDIEAGNPISQEHYFIGWKILDKFGVKVT